MIKRLARAELRRHRAETRFLKGAIALAMTVMTYFVLSACLFIAQISEQEIPEKSFFSIMQFCLLAIAVIAFGLAVYILFGAFRLHVGRQQEMLGVLDSLGAGRGQLLSLLLEEGKQLSYTALPLGIFLGVLLSLLPLPGMQSGRAERYLLLPIVFLLGFGVIELAAAASLLGTKKKSAIVRLRGNHNPNLVRKKSYRKSKTFSRLPVPVQLGRKNVDHNAHRYRTIAVTFACAASVLLIGMILYHYLGNIDVVVDANPYDGVDTAEATVSAVLRMLSLTAVLSFLLAVMSATHAVNVVFGVMREREREFAVLQSIGMDYRQIEQMVIGECSAIGMMTIGWCFVFSLVISTAFSLIFYTVDIYYPFIPVLIGCGIILLAVRLLGNVACRYLTRINVIESIK